MKKIFVVISLFVALAITSCKKQGTFTVYVKKQLPGQALQYAGYATVIVYQSDSVTQAGSATANQYGVAAVDLKDGDYLVYAIDAADSTLTGATTATLKKGERLDVNVTIQ